MKEYLVSVITVSVGLSVARLLVSFGDGKGVYKAVSFVTALIFFVAVISPVRGIPSLAEYFENAGFANVYEREIKHYSAEQTIRVFKDTFGEDEPMYEREDVE